MSTGLECEFFCADHKSWYYILQDWSCPVGAWDWREYATCYGPFITEVAAQEHLRRNHANPGGYNIYECYKSGSDPVLDALIESAQK